MIKKLNRFGIGDSTGLVVLAEIFLGAGAFGIYVIVLPKFIPRFTKVPSDDLDTLRFARLP